MTTPNPTLLVVDDNEANLYVRSRILRRAGFAVLEARTGYECLRLVASARPALVLLDMNLPDLHGSEVCRRIKRDATFTTVFVLHISASLISPQEKANALDDGADGYLIEPVEPEELIATVRALLRLQQAEVALRQANSRFERAERAANGFVFEMDLVSGQVTRSPNFTQVTGYAVDEVVPTLEGWTQLIHPDDLARFRAQNSFTSGATSSEAYRVRHKDGHYIWVQEQGLIERNEQDQPVMVTGTTLDITKRKQTEALLEFHAGLLDYAYDAVIATDTEHNITAWNRGAEIMYGWPVDEVLGRKAHEVLQSSMTPSARAKATRQLAATGRFQVEVTTHHRDGTPILVEGHNVVMRNTDGQITGYMSITRDIRERKRAEEALRASEDRLRTFVDSAPTMMGVVELAADDSDILHLFDNVASEHFFSVAPGGTAGRWARHELGVTDDTAHEWISAYRKAQQTGRPVRFPYAFAGPPTSNGAMQRQWLDVSVSYIGPGDAGSDRFCYTAINDTERVLAEAVLAEREAFLRAITDAVPNLIGYIDQHKRYRFVNATYAQWFARSREEIEGGTMQDLLGEHLNNWRKHWQRALDGETVHFEETFSYPDGVTRTVMGTYIPDRAADGQVLGFYLYVNDITARKQAEAAVAARERELRVITDNIPSLISYVDNTRCYRFANAAYEQWYQRPRAQIVGQPMPTVQGEAFYQHVRPYVERGLQGEFVQFEVTVPYPSGIRTIWATFVPNTDAQGVVHGFYALVTDISERKRAEEQLRASEERLRLALEGGGLGIWEWQIPTDTATWTEQEYALFGLTPDTLVTHELFENLIHPADRAETVAALNNLATQGGDYKGEYRVIHPDGQVRWLAERCVLIRDTQGQPVRILGVNFDITERKNAEHELQQFNERLDREVKERTAELTKRLSELDGFAYVTSHDLKAPLRAIDHLAHWIDEDAGALLPSPSREHLAKMRGRIKRMEKLLDALLAYSRADRYQYTVEQVDVTQLLDDIVRLVTPPEGFAVSAQPPLPVLRTQKVPLETVLRNLISNAIKHHDRRDGHVQVAVQEVGEFLEFSVSDDGPGIAPEFHERIFQIFQTLKPRDEVEGSGMGLAIVKKIIESRGGRIAVTSTPGVGATFTFTWPKRQTDVTR